MAEIMEEDKVTIKEEVKEEIKEDVDEGSTENRGTVRCFICRVSPIILDY